MLVKMPNDQLLSIVWRHEQVKCSKRFEGTVYENKIVRKTTCIVKNGIGKEVPRIGEASTTQSPLDTDCKNCGRRISLDRVIKKLDIAREDRHLFWEAYKDMRGGQW